MMNKNERSARFLAPIAISALLVMGFLFCQPDAALAQTNWSGGILNRAAEAIAAHSRTPQGPSSIQSKSVAKVTIQSITAGRIPKFMNGSGALDDSVITELTGNIGIGTTSPSDVLHVRGGNVQGIRIESTSIAPILDFYTTAGGENWSIRTNYTTGGLFEILRATVGSAPTTSTLAINGSSGNVGIGTTNPGAKLEVAGRIFSTGTAAENSFQDRTSTRQWTWYGTGDMARFWNSGIGDMLFVTPSGNVGIGAIPATSNKLHVAGSAYVTGNLTVDGTLAAKYQDVAEWVPASRAISAGTVVVVDADRSNHVLPSTHAYDTSVAGVVSANPGVILGEKGEGKVMVATTGRVKVKVDATNAPIRVGDLLVTSNKEGIAMRSQPLDLGGTPIHRPGTLIGKALEPLAKGVGEILVLLSLQ